MDYNTLGVRLEQSNIYRFWKRYDKFIHAIMGILIILLLAGMWTIQLKQNKLATEINENCGWGEEDYYCYCEMSEAIALKNAFEAMQEAMGVDNVTLVG